MARVRGMRSVLRRAVPLALPHPCRKIFCFCKRLHAARAARHACFFAYVCRGGIEIRRADFRPEYVTRIRAAGMFAAVWSLPRCDFDEVYGGLFAVGVSEFTEDFHLAVLEI